MLWRCCCGDDSGGAQARKYLHFKEDKEADVPWIFIRAAVESVARLAIIPMQDIMGLDNSARMNIPAVQVCRP